MEEIDIYDFDKTLIPFDSGSLFIGYCLLRYPWIIITMPIIACGFILMLLDIISFTRFKRTSFLFVSMIPLEKAVKGFWNRHEKQVFPWFAERKRKCVVISASPDFLLEEIAQRLSFDYLICTRHNRRNGAIIGENCRGPEKVRRLREELPDFSFADVYSDSYKYDKYIFSLSGAKCYHIENGRRVEFDFKEKYGETF